MQLQRKKSFYEKYIKRVLDIICALLALVFTGWLFVIIAIVVRIKMGSPVLFKQPRPGMVDPKTGKEAIFDMYKFRSMTDERDADGNLLPDGQRLPKFGAWLRNTSLDELPETFNILKGDMSVIGPRPQLVRDMVFMSDEQRMRHTAKPGLSGLAPVRGRNAISWEEKLNFKLVFETIKTALIKQEGITDGENATALDYGDVLLKEGKISEQQYDTLRDYAQKLIIENESKTT